MSIGDRVRATIPTFERGMRSGEEVVEGVVVRTYANRGATLTFWRQDGSHVAGRILVIRTDDGREIWADADKTRGAT